MKRQRREDEIIALILEVVEQASIGSNSNGATQTAILYKSFLNYIQLKEYLLFLTEKHLLEYRVSDRVYRITDKGKRFLQIYNQMNNMFTVTKY